MSHVHRKSVHFEDVSNDLVSGDPDLLSFRSPSNVLNGSGTGGLFANSSFTAAAAANTPNVNTAPLPPFVLTKEDVLSAFEFFDVAQTGYITQPVLKSRLAAFYPNMTSKEYKFLLEQTATPTATGNMIPVETDAGGGKNVVVGGTMTAAQLWELVETFQRLFMVPAMERAAAAAAATVAEAAHHHLSPSAAAAGAMNSSITSAMMTEGLRTFDPVRETFENVFDPGHTGAMPIETLLKPLMARLGYGDLQPSDLRLLVRTADFDGDGQINLMDFRRLVAMKGRFRHKPGSGSPPSRVSNAAHSPAMRGTAGATASPTGGTAKRPEPAGGGAAAVKKARKGHGGTTPAAKKG
ncbi:hypothetical protein STCU_10549 [Strigomonas culicis]|uniref:EF-hand domain-containing protein n=1 Tax=Strigomonas culicis TaxID=28005 RepID=S9TL67_9TRYP|nr:hypothetical protein STCU_10549 [Strigomonas culicis]|eukprot:EPY17544.1 hypothetical protein STCU_10549 [Strigomonas culicis]